MDHIFFVLKDRNILKAGQLHKARSVIHELIGFFLIGVLTLITGIFNQTTALLVGLTLMIHLAQDIIMGISIPFNPIDKTEIKLLPQKQLLKILIDTVIIVLFGVLWIKYLNGQV